MGGDEAAESGEGGGQWSSATRSIRDAGAVAAMIPNLPSLPLTEADWLFAVLLGLILVVPLLSERVRVPGIVGLVLAGALVGPGGLGLVVREGAVGTLGSVGLLYLMFLAGVELDLEEFAAHKRDSVIFGILTFLIPMSLGVGSAMLLGFGVLAAVLIASCWASHTLLTYPVFRRHGTVANRAVATSVGGTILTDTAALVVLVVVASAHVGDLESVFWVSLAAGMAVLAFFTLWVLPRLGRWFFARIAREQGVRFVFVLAALFMSSALAHLGGMEPIIGAFLAGLGLNKLVPNGSRLMERIEFVGANFLIPLFLVAVGLVINFRLLADPRTLLMAVVFTTVAIAAKALAAGVSGKLLGYSRTEIGAIFALSNAQAAATLAAIVVGERVGLIDTDVVNAVIMVILVTCLLASWSAGRIAPKLVRPMPRQALGTSVILPVIRPEAAVALTRLAASFAETDAGVVVPVTVAVGDDGVAAIDDLRRVNEEVEEMARAHGVEAEGAVRIDRSAAAGVLNIAAERKASLLVMGWHGPDHRAMFAAEATLDPVVAEASAPVLLARLDRRTPERILVFIPHADTTEGGMANLRLVLDTARRLGALHRCPVIAVSSVDDASVLAEVNRALDTTTEVDSRSPTAVLKDAAGPDDLVVFPVKLDDLHLRGAERLNRVVADSQVIAAVGGAPAPPEPRAGRRRHAEVPLSPL